MSAVNHTLGVCENSLKLLLRKSVLRGDLFSQRSRDTKKWGPDKKGDQAPLHTVSVNNILGDSVLYRLLLSRAITGPSFNFIPFVEVFRKVCTSFS